MKHLRMVVVVGLAAMALMAWGTGTASGTVLCKTNANTETCPEPYFTGQALEASLKKETTAVLETLEGTVLDTCTGTTLKAKTTNSGGSSEAVNASVESLSWSGCTKTTDNISTKGSLEFEWIAGTDNATLTAGGTEWTVNTIFGSCNYGFGSGTDLGTVVGGSPATITVNVLVKKTGGNINCPAEARWTATYTFTETETALFHGRLTYERGDGGCRPLSKKLGLADD